MTPDAKIPEWIPTWVTPPPVAVPVVATPATISVVPTEGPLDRGVRSLVRFFAKLLGKPDPITGELPVASKTTPAPGTAAAPKTGNFVDKMWSAANKAVDTATTVATKAVEVTTSTVNQAVEWVKDVKADIDAASTPVAPATTQPLETLEKTQ